MNAHSYIHLIFDNGAKNIQWRIDSWEKWLATCRKLKLEPSPSSCTSINSKWIKDLNVRPNTLQLEHKRAENTLETIGIRKDFLSRTPISPATKRKNGQMGLREIKKLLHNKRNGL
jgi:hypothetical protein